MEPLIHGLEHQPNGFRNQAAVKREKNKNKTETD
jgi:hypothetical protein